MTDTAEGAIVVYDRHGERHVIPDVTAQLWIETGRLFLEPPAQPMPHANPNGPGYKWTEVSADGNGVSDYFSYGPPSADYLARHNIPITHP